MLETLKCKELDPCVHLVFPPLFSFHIINKEELRPKKGDLYIVGCELIAQKKSCTYI